MKPSYIFEIEEYAYTLKGTKAVPKYVVAIFPNDIDLSRIEWTKRARQYYGNIYPRKIAHENEFCEIIELQNNGQDSYRDSNVILYWKSYDVTNSYCEFTYKEANSHKHNQSSKAKSNAASTVSQSRPIQKSDLTFTLYVYAKFPTKFMSYSKMEPVKAGLICVDGRVRNIVAFYCVEEKKYFARYSDYQEFQRKYGGTLTKIFKMSDLGIIYDRFGNQFQLNQYSELNQRGYNVNKQDNLSDEERHKILASLIDHNVMKRQEILRYLEYFINMNGSAANMEDAKSKWKEDSQFVLTYKMGSYRQVQINNVKSSSKSIRVYK